MWVNEKLRSGGEQRSWNKNNVNFLYFQLSVSLNRSCLLSQINSWSKQTSLCWNETDSDLFFSTKRLQKNRAPWRTAGSCIITTHHVPTFVIPKTHHTNICSWFVILSSFLFRVATVWWCSYLKCLSLHSFSCQSAFT